MHSYGLFWQLPASLEVNPGELAAPLGFAPPAPGLASVQSSVLDDVLSKDNLASTKGSAVHIHEVDCPWSMWHSPPASLSGLLRGNINLQLLT